MTGGNAMGAVGQPGQGMYNPQPQTPEPGSIFAGAAVVPEGKACPKCGSVVTGAFCGNCGAKMEEEPAPEAAPEVAEAPVETEEAPAEETAE